MIIVAIVLFTALAVWGTFFLKGAKGLIVGGIAIVLLALSTLGLIVHDNNHWGMKKVTSTTYKNIPVQMVMAIKIGSNSGNYVFSYKSNDSDKKPSQHFMPDESNITESVKKSATYEETSDKTAEVKTVTTRWQWSNNFAKALFSVGGEGGELYKQTNTVRVPKGTLAVLTQDQAKKLAANQDKMQAQAKSEQEAQVKAATEKAIAEATAELPAGAPASAKAEIAQQVQEKVQAEVAAKQKALMNDPVAYAQAQVTAVKAFLNNK